MKFCESRIYRDLNDKANQHSWPILTIGAYGGSAVMGFGLGMAYKAKKPVVKVAFSILAAAGGFVNNICQQKAGEKALAAEAVSDMELEDFINEPVDDEK